MNLNKVFLIGRLTADPQLKALPSGQSVATCAIATNRNWVDKTGKRQEEVQFHNIVIWGKQAEIVNQFLKKGSILFVEGRLQTRSWQDKEGQTRKTTEIVCERMQLGPRAMGVGGYQSNAGAAPFQQKNNSSAAIPEEIGEKLPEINIDDGEVKAEDIPF